MRHPFLLLLAFALVTSWQVTGAEALLRVDGEVLHPLQVGVAELEKMPHFTVKAKEHGGAESSWEGVAVAELLKRAGAPVGKDLRGKALAAYVVATAQDGYRATFSLAELDSTIRDSDVFVVYQHEGRPMASPEGPLRLIVATDKKPARSVRMLERLTVNYPRKGEE